MGIQLDLQHYGVYGNPMFSHNLILLQNRTSMARLRPLGTAWRALGRDTAHFLELQQRDAVHVGKECFKNLGK